MLFSYPLKLKFKLIALAPRINVLNAEKQEIFYIEQKILALKEAVKVFNNAKDKKLQYTIAANQILDFGAKYHIKTAEDKLLGAVQQHAMRSLFRGSYMVLDSNDQEIFTITQTNPWISLLDSIINIIPFAELITGFILNPVYKVTAKDTQEAVLLMKKKASFFEAQFDIIALKSILPDQEKLLILSLLMVVQLERDRG